MGSPAASTFMVVLFGQVLGQRPTPCGLTCRIFTGLTSFLLII